EHPDSILNFYCYADYTQPPGIIKKLNHNLCPWLAPIRYCRYHHIGHLQCPSRNQLQEIIDKWTKVTDKFGYRTYNFNLAECLVPYSKLAIWKHDIPYLKSKGCIGISLETLNNWLIYGPHIYLSIRLAYDPSADTDALMEDYYLKFYGTEAGPIMKQYWSAIDREFDSLTCHSGSFYALHLVYTPQFLEFCQSLLDKAKTVANTDQHTLVRVNMASLGLQNAAQYMQIRDAINKGEIASAKKQYQKLLGSVIQQNKSGLGNQYSVRYLQRFIGLHLNAVARVAAPPNQVLQVLPDRWRLNYNSWDNGLKRGHHLLRFDDSSWIDVLTFSNTLNAQGLPDRKETMWYRTTFDLQNKPAGLSLFFMEIDGSSIVYLNGQKVGECPKPRYPFEVDVTKTAVKGRNVLAVCIDHSHITELFLGGIIRPVFLLEK
ncbi:DUF4838 domain-containing protein, partial [candidate division CSSED10-310 bacterium]